MHAPTRWRRSGDASTAPDARPAAICDRRGGGPPADCGAGMGGRWPARGIVANTRRTARWPCWTQRRAAGHVIPSQPIIAVLPFENLSDEPESDDFVDGLTDEIIRNLGVIQGLQVKSRDSSFAFKDKPRDLRDVGQQLGVNLVVDGSVLRSGNKLRVNAQLIQVAGDVPLWTDGFDRELKDIFAIQDDISRAIVNKLRLTLGRGQRRYETKVEVYELYLKGRALVGRRGPPTSRRPRKCSNRSWPRIRLRTRSRRAGDRVCDHVRA